MGNRERRGIGLKTFGFKMLCELEVYYQALSNLEFSDNCHVITTK